jgi:penicillin amidase/acyl-homoserine-lactone acylase
MIWGRKMAALRGTGLLILAAAAGAALWLRTPSPARFDAEAALVAAKAYDVRIIRDKWGVPHVYGARDADVAFGLAYAHAEDDWKTIEDVILFARGKLGLRAGKDGAVTDYLIAALGVWHDIDKKFETDLSPQTRAMLDGYAAGVNFWCAEDRSRCAPGVAPVSAKDVVAGFVSRTPFFYGLDGELKKIFESQPEKQAALTEIREAFLHVAPGVELGSNAIAVAPSRSADAHTRLMVNSHQPYTGPVAWYEARLKSNEGWDMIGGVFPGSPVILHGAGPELGWAHTVNAPDLVDIYALQVDDPKKPTKYLMDGEWRPLERSPVTLRVKLFGPFSLPVSREVYRSAHGPVFVTDKGVFAVAFGGQGDIGAVEQWYDMNKATSFAGWRQAMARQSIPSLNAVYADKSGMIAYYYNAAIPVRNAAADWSGVVDGTRGDLLWAGVRPFGSAPFIVAPASGYVVNANHSPFDASASGDNPKEEDFPPHFGVDRNTTNRGIRIQALYGADPAIDANEFIAYKFDHQYAADSRLRRLIDRLAADAALAGDPETAEAVALLKGWDGSMAREDRAAALAVRIGYLNLGYRLIGAIDPIEEADPEAALRRAARELKAGFGRIDPKWGEAVQLKRGEVNLGLNGGPDILRAVYPTGTPEAGTQASAGGDTYILYADWPTDGGAPLIRTIHQFGSATLDEKSPHFADQAPLFAGEEWKTPAMTLEAVLAEATRDYRPGR